MNLIVFTTVDTPQQNEEAVNKVVVFSRRPEDIDSFVNSLSELSKTNFFHDLLFKINDSEILIEDTISELVIAMQGAAVKRQRKTVYKNGPYWFDKDCSFAKKMKSQALRKFRNNNKDTD